jgi:hypothetical protein
MAKVLHTANVKFPVVERTTLATPPYTNGLILTGNGPLPTADRLSTATPPPEASSRKGIIPDMNYLATFV